MKETTVPATTEKAEVPDTREASRTLTPAVDIFEHEDDLVVVADLPGVEKESVDVRVEDNILTLKATAKTTLPGEPSYREYTLLNFFRQFELSDKVNRDNIKAQMKHGVLTISLPKREEEKPKRIAVEVA
jgi:HSP20 family molecular chaperone IbpA